ncbi:MAG: FHA domain-containing protein [Deltaproteobacteria bacterium]|nr:MAG: FHA domain-containing protein [Deltaproteobacteria bacterium]
MSSRPRDPASARVTQAVGGRAHGGDYRQFRLTVLEGPAAGATFSSTGPRCSIGSHPSNDLVIDDPTVSRFHSEIAIEDRGVEVRDLDSQNGTNLDGVWVTSAFVREGSLLALGHTVLSFGLTASTFPALLSDATRFGSLIGESPAMRATFALLERAAASHATVLLEGETGTGKEEAALSIHAASPRAAGPFVVVDCGAMPAALLESELFGHEKGAFTGAATQRTGAFEAAGGGTVFLDEIGELPLELQPKLLRVLERREIRRLGSNAYRPADVRVIAATHRDLRAGVNGETFRADLYYRLAVLRVALPPLRARPDDISALARHLVEQIGAPPAAAARLLEPEFLASLARSAWPGNVRELRNHLERCAVFEQPALPDPIAEPRAPTRVDIRVPYGVARARLLAEFERAYADELLRAHDGNLSAAARAGGLDRVHLWRLAGRHGLK